MYCSYFTAGVYLNLLEKYKDDDVVDGRIIKRSKIRWTSYARSIFKDNKVELKKVIEEIWSHEVFNEAIKIFLRTGFIPDNKKIYQIMKNTELKLSAKTTYRRAQSVFAWLNWIIQFIS